MGDRGNLILHYEEGNKIYFYTHWSGSALPKILKKALKRGKDRWNDEPYLSRILFCEMVKDDISGNTGFGISPYQGDGGVDLEKQTVTYKEETKTFEEYIQ